MAEIERVDRYIVLVNGHEVRATERQEEILRQMDDDAVARFLAVTGVICE